MNDQNQQNLNEQQTVQQTTLKPQPVVKKPLWYKLVRGAGVVVMAGGGVFTLMLATMPRLSGASRSARLKWQTRQKQVNAAIENAKNGKDEIEVAPVTDAPKKES